MFHPDRRFSIVSEEDPEELALKLTRQNLTSCTGFERAGYLFLNDSTGPDGAQEYAVFRKEPEPSGRNQSLPGGFFRSKVSRSAGWMRRRRSRSSGISPAETATT
jgi:hypothetical protein